MNEIEPTAEAWMDAVRVECPILPPISVATVALQRALLEIKINEQKLADLRQEVSDAVQEYASSLGVHALYRASKSLGKFVIHKPKPDPLVAALEGVTFDHYPLNDAKTIRAVLDAAGLEIKEKNDE